MRKRDVVTFRRVCRKAKPHDVALHRVESVRFGVDAHGACGRKFSLHLFENFIGIDADIRGQVFYGETCGNGFSVSVFASAFRAFAVTHESGFARDLLEQAQQAVDFMILEHLRERIHVQAVVFERLEVSVERTLGLERHEFAAQESLLAVVCEVVV